MDQGVWTPGASDAHIQAIADARVAARNPAYLVTATPTGNVAYPTANLAILQKTRWLHDPVALTGGKFYCSTFGTSPTVDIGLYSATGDRLASQGPALLAAGTGLKPLLFTAPYTPAFGEELWVAFVCSTTTMQLSRTTVPFVDINAETATALTVATTGATLPPTIDVSAPNGSVFLPWVVVR